MRRRARNKKTRTTRSLLLAPPPAAAAALAVVAVVGVITIYLHQSNDGDNDSEDEGIFGDIKERFYHFLRRTNHGKMTPNKEVVAPQKCLVMISFNSATAGEVAKRLANYLTSNGRPAFCTGNYCATQAGNWRRFTKMGANTCLYYVPLITFGWQDSGECQYETNIVENRLAGGKVTIIPVWFDSFDEKYDDQRGHYYKNSWSHLQGVPSKKNDPNTINETILNLIPPLNDAVPKDDCPYVATPNGLVDLCLIMRPPTSAQLYLSGATKHVSALQGIQDMVEKAKILKGTKAIIADGNHVLYMEELKKSCHQINLLILCAEGLSLEDEEDTEDGNFIFHDSKVMDLLRSLKPKVLVLVMRYGSKLLADKLHVVPEISSIIPIRHNAFEEKDGLNELYREVLIPASAEFLSSPGIPVSEYRRQLEIKFRKIRDDVLVQDVIGRGDFLSPMFSLEGEQGVEKMYGSSHDALPWNTEGNTTTPADWMTDRLMRQLPLGLGDIETVQHFADELKHSNSIMKVFHFRPQKGEEEKETFQRARSLALHLCHFLAADNINNIFNGIFRVTSQIEAKKVADALKGERHGRALIWIDVGVANPFVDKGNITAWMADFPKPQITFLLTRGGYCGASVVAGVDCVRGQIEENDAGIEFEQDDKSRVSRTLYCLDAMHNPVNICIVLKETGRQDLANHRKELRDTVGSELFPLGKYDEHNNKGCNIKLYVDDGCGDVHFHFRVTNIKQLISICNVILFQNGQGKLKKALEDQHLLTKDSEARIEEENAMNILDRAVLQLDSMTEDQMDVKEAWHEMKTASMRIDGAAGTGKTFVALDCILETLKIVKGTNQIVLFTTESESLCFYVAKWLYTRLLKDENSTDKAETMLKSMRFFTNNSPGKAFEINISRKNKLEKKSYSEINQDFRRSIVLFVVDEAHDIFTQHGESDFKSTVKTLAKEKNDDEGSRLLLLSDESQASSFVDWSHMEGIQRRKLVTSCRATKRLTLASMLYQVRQSSDAKCAHNLVDGPMPKSYIFPKEEESETKFNTYADNIIEALRHMTEEQFTDRVDLDLRIAIAVPNKEFKDTILDEGDLKRKLEDKGWVTVDALDAVKSLGKDSQNADCNRKKKKKKIVFDVISSLNGLEFIGVIAVGLDKEMKPNDDPEARKLHQSMLYRAISRSRFTFAVINEDVDNGWLTWLNRSVKVEGNEDTLDFDSAKGRVDPGNTGDQLKTSRTDNMTSDNTGDEGEKSYRYTPSSGNLDSPVDSLNDKIPGAVEKDDRVITQNYFDTSSNNVGLLGKGNPEFLPIKYDPIRNPDAVEPADKALMREYGIIFISARFDGGPREQEARYLKEELVMLGLDARMVEAGAGDDFGDKTHAYLYSMKTMIAFCFDNYGQKTVSKYSTYHELHYAYDEDKRIIPIKRCAEWPPKPPLDHDGGNKGSIQNAFVFKNSSAYLDWSNKKWNPAECAKEVKEALLLHKNENDDDDFLDL